MQARRDALAGLRRGETVTLHLARAAGGHWLVVAPYDPEKDEPCGRLVLVFTNKRLRVEWCTCKDGVRIGRRFVGDKYPSDILGIVLEMDGKDPYGSFANQKWMSYERERAQLLRRIERRTLLLFRLIRLGRDESPEGDELREKLADDYYAKWTFQDAPVLDQELKKHIDRLGGDLNYALDGGSGIEGDGAAAALRDVLLSFAERWRAAGFTRAAQVFAAMAWS
jgi:hypothetical protein